LAEKRRLQQQAESVTRELKRAEQSGSTLTRNEKIDMVLRSFEGVYDSNLIKQLRQDLNEREAGLNKQITESNQQIATLQSRLDCSILTEEKLTNEIQTLTKSKHNAEAELERIKLGTAERSNEVIRLKESIQTMTKEISNLQSQLQGLMQERDSSRNGLQVLREWKTKAEAERTKLENELKMKDGFIEKLKYDLKERNEDVNVLVPEV
jgi:chromosome segregation ATPase